MFLHHLSCPCTAIHSLKYIKYVTCSLFLLFLPSMCLVEYQVQEFFPYVFQKFQMRFLIVNCSFLVVLVFLQTSLLLTYSVYCILSIYWENHISAASSRFISEEFVQHSLPQRRLDIASQFGTLFFFFLREHFPIF